MVVVLVVFGAGVQKQQQQSLSFTLQGMTLFTSKEHMCRAALESTAFQAVDIMEACGVSGHGGSEFQARGLKGRALRLLTEDVSGSGLKRMGHRDFTERWG